MVRLRLQRIRKGLCSLRTRAAQWKGSQAWEARRLESR
jgi:hypothetical protein